VLMAGKPFAPIYELAMERAGRPRRDEVLAIGDGPETDIKGAADFGIAAVMITEGINQSGDDVAAAAERLVPGFKLAAHMQHLTWI
jgi:ribonucleotide monophosphatase NagD (HAD superfamily)